jgi:hypothetical protein
VTGAVTKWSFLSAGVADGRTFVLRVLRPADTTGNAWTAVATSQPAQVLNSGAGVDALEGPFATNLPIRAGDRIALQATNATDVPLEMAAGANGVRYFASTIPDGTTASLAPGATMDTGQLVPVQASVVFATPANQTLPTIWPQPAAGRVITCGPGIWSGGPSYAYAWSLTQLLAVPNGAKKAPHFVHRTTPFGTGQSITVPDLRPGSSSLTCTVTATDSAGSVSAPSPPATVLAVAPYPGSSIHIGRRSISPKPHIAPGVGAGGTNFCSPGLWRHYPTSFRYTWRRSGPPVGHKASYTLTARDERRRIVCYVTAANSAGATTVSSNSYVVPVTAPVNTGQPVIFGTSTPRPPGTSPPANPGALNGNSFHLSCAAGRWNRPDLTFSYQWVFDRPSDNQSPAQLTGLVVPGVNIALTINPPNGPLQINASPPLINGRAAYGLDYLDDSMQCEVTAKAPSGRTGMALSPVVKLRGPVANL